MAAIGRFVADHWVIVDADGRVIDRSRFLNVIESGALSHGSIESTDVRFASTAIRRWLRESRPARDGSWDRVFTTRERATDVLARLTAVAVRLLQFTGVAAA